MSRGIDRERAVQDWLQDRGWHTPEFERRFWTKVARGDAVECWPWEGATDSGGYGKIWTPRPGRRIISAHRASWVMAHEAAVPDGLVIDHLCRNPRCVNPGHLEAVPLSVNTIRDKPNVCPRGHLLEGLRRQRDLDGSRRMVRYCKVCDKGRKVSRRAARERGAQRERAVKALLEHDGYLVTKSGGSLGAADLVALKAGSPSLLVQVKSDELSPYGHFGPRERAELLRAGEIAGASVVLCWWPPARGKRTGPQWIWPDAWPAARGLAA